MLFVILSINNIKYIIKLEGKFMGVVMTILVIVLVIIILGAVGANIYILTDMVLTKALSSTPFWRWGTET